MKTILFSTLMFLALVNQNYGKPILDIYSAKDPFTTEESYVDDIPFDTWEIAVAAVISGDEANLAEESYIDDIPFDTRTIVMQIMLKKLTDKPDESNVNDIPFDTKKVMYDQLAVRMTDEYRDEQNTADLPGNDFNICNKDQESTHYVTVKLNETKKYDLRYKKYNRIEYPVIMPVKLGIPRVEMKSNDLHPEIIALPSPSL